MNAINSAVKDIFEVRNPIDETENLTDRLTDSQKKRFQEAIADLATDADEAVATEDKKEAAKLWRRQFGDRFPKIEEKDDEKQKKEDSAKLAVACAATNPPKPWAF